METSLSDYKLLKFITTDNRLSWLWLLLRLYLGWLWVEAGWEKLHSAAWVGDQAGTALTGFIGHSLSLTAGLHPAVFGWYAWFLENLVLPNVATFSYLVTFGELAVGVALILGLFTVKAAFFGSFMNLNYLLAGTAGLNPIMLVLQILLMIAWRPACWIGLDRWIYPKLITWDKNKTFFE